MFNEPLDTLVFTTKYVVYENSPIVFVTHDDDGSWQFHGPEKEVKDEDVRVVLLSELIEIDNTVKEISDLPEGFEAMRTSKFSSWKKLSSN